MPQALLLHDLTCVIHVHSTHSDGTGTVAEIAAAARRSGVDVVLLTDHDTIRARSAGEEGWHGPVLVLVGEEVSPRTGNHTLAFGADAHIRRRGRTAAQICDEIAAHGGAAFAAHPFFTGSKTFKRLANGTPYDDLDARSLTGIELWSFVTDTVAHLTSVAEAVRFVAAPASVVDDPPPENIAGWESMLARRRVVAIGGLDAHQLGVRVGGQVPLRAMSYARSFRHLRTHVLCEELPDGELGHDSAQVYSALREGRCYLAVDSLAPARGFDFWADRVGPDGWLPMGGQADPGAWTLHVRLPRPARLRLLRDGELVAEAASAGALDHAAGEPGVYRVEAAIDAGGRSRTWIISNPIYLR